MLNTTGEMVDGSFASPSTTSKPLNGTRTKHTRPGTAIITSPLCVNTSVRTKCDFGDSDHAMTTKTCVSLDRRAPSFFLVLATLGNPKGLVQSQSNRTAVSCCVRRVLSSRVSDKLYATTKTPYSGSHPSAHAKTHLYLIPRTEVPVTIGCVVCCLVPSMAAAACPAPRAGPAAEWQSILLDDETRGAIRRRAAEHSKRASMQRFLNCKERRTVHERKSRREDEDVGG